MEAKLDLLEGQNKDQFITNQSLGEKIREVKYQLDKKLERDRAEYER